MSMPTKLSLVFLGLILGGTALLAAAGYLTMVSARSDLQEVADEAAISGVLALASNKERGAATAQREAAIAASNIITSRIEGAWVSITPKDDDLALSVRISAPHQARILGLSGPIEVVGAARYLSPAQQDFAQASENGWNHKLRMSQNVPH
jgi:hypothetical protein